NTFHRSGREATDIRGRRTHGRPTSGSSAAVNKICVVGQVLDKGIPRVSPSGASIMIWTEKGLPIVQARANVSGEFQLEFEPQDGLRLSVNVDGRRTIRIPLANLKAVSAAE